MKSNLKFLIILFILFILLTLQYNNSQNKDGTVDLINFEDNPSLLNSFMDIAKVNDQDRKYKYYLLTFVDDLNFCCRSGKVIQFLDSISINFESIKTCVFLPPTFSDQDIKNLRENHTLDINFYLGNTKFTSYQELSEMVVFANNDNKILYQTSFKNRNAIYLLKRFLQNEKF